MPERLNAKRLDDEYNRRAVFYAIAESVTQDKNTLINDTLNKVVQIADAINGLNNRAKTR
ncbi:hypothetical protein C9J12_02840 [Photobacterium frigidiphilum]|uniref:Uncharacterized protein n=1 Tax=Photobacterium frigidiphilum TaxID=264736 RepID=A0A2T3JPD2_9GAMM|nr:hypothetical protein C9J12_02840 [Photobacterium frigidiphilum]